MNKTEVARMIDHTILKADATEVEIVKLCEEALEYGFASVCINPCFVPLAADLLAKSQVKVCTVIGFPLGATTTTVKAIEAKEAVDHGALEVDMVINIGALKQGKVDYVRSDIEAVVETAKKANAATLVKVIIETCLLTEAEKETVIGLCLAAGADFVKTSTGFSTGGATIEDVRLMRRIVGTKAQVKASGGVRSYQDFLVMTEAGADRIGTSNGIGIISQAE